MTGLSQIAEQEWNEEHRRAAIVRLLVEFNCCPRKKTHKAADELGLLGV